MVLSFGAVRSKLSRAPFPS